MTYIGAVVVVEVLLAAAALLLFVAGVTKLRAPVPAMRAARAMALPATANTVRLLAAIEIVVGVSALVSASAVARVALGVLYAAFLVFVVAAIARNAPISSCGCFGSNDVPPSLAHVAVNACAAAVAFVAALDDIDAPLDAIAESAGDAVVIVVGAVALATLGAALLGGRVGGGRTPARPGRTRR
jgi:hypothetical protein